MYIDEAAQLFFNKNKGKMFFNNQGDVFLLEEYIQEKEEFILLSEYNGVVCRNKLSIFKFWDYLFPIETAVKACENVHKWPIT